MKKISTTVPDSLIDGVDRAARTLDRSRAQIFRQALESYLADLDHEVLKSLALPNPDLLLLDWDEVEQSILAAD
jgi:hypothetical protein